MNKREARRIVNSLVAKSLRRLASNQGRWKTLGEIPDGLTEGGVKKVAGEMLALADKLAPEREPIDA